MRRKGVMDRKESSIENNNNNRLSLNQQDSIGKNLLYKNKQNDNKKKTNLTLNSE